MAYEETNRGAIWGNRKKETERHPDFTGSLNVEGVEYWVSAWKRRADQSDKAPSLSFQIRRKEAAPVQTAMSSDDPDADIPF